jgi:hypothetical protein
LAIIALIVFCLYRQKQNKQQKQFGAAGAQHEQEEEPIHVDWDKIEDHFKEIPMQYTGSSGNATRVNSPQLHDNNISSALIGSHQSPNSTESGSVVDHNINSLDHQQLNNSPHIIAGNYPTVVKPSEGHSIVKPNVHE